MGEGSTTGKGSLMKIEVRKPVTIEPTAIRIAAAVRYDEEDMPNDFPGRKGDVWHAVVDGATGRIRDWPADRTAEFHMKACDQGTYTLLGAEDDLAEITNDYVPTCIPGEYGDYLIFKIGPDGTVANWAKFWTAERVKESFFREDWPWPLTLLTSRPGRVARPRSSGICGTNGNRSRL